jgi:C4-dicarboxylate-specific signal transduction histidine kinase
VREELKDGLSSVEDAVTIVERFRNFARKSSERTFCETDLGEAVEKIVELLNESAKRAKTAIIVKNMGRLPRVWANRQDVEQFFFAMIQNAMQAADGKSNRRLTISGVKKDEHIELRFADNCGGISPENIDRIFQPFFTTSTDGTRTGLGLCIVQRILSECGGKIRVASKYGKGTTFHITLPAYSGRTR